MRLLKQLLTVSALSFAVLAPAIGQMPGGGPLPEGAKKVPGEKWRTKVSMEMQGMSMPARTMEVCAPVGKANERLAKPEDKNCTMYDTKTTGNTFSGKIRCTGEHAMEGEIESSTTGNTVRSTMHMRMKSGGEMTMRSEGTKLGACEAVDYSDVKMPTVADPRIEMCAKVGRDLQENPGKTQQAYLMFLNAGREQSTCGTFPSKKIYCDAVQTHRGFLGLRVAETAMANDPSFKAQYKSKPQLLIPVASSVESCGLGKGSAGVESLRLRLLGQAEEAKEWPFMIIEGGQPERLRLQAIAKEFCTGRGFTGTKSKAHRNLCLMFGPDLIAGRFDKAKQTALTGERSEDESESSSSGSSSGAGDAAQTSEDPKKSKTQDAVDKGKKLLRGILGR